MNMGLTHRALIADSLQIVYGRGAFMKPRFSCYEVISISELYDKYSLVTDGLGFYLDSRMLPN